MGVFDDFWDKAKDVADAAGKKTGELVDLSKYKLRASQLNGEIRANYEKLGHAVHSMAKAGYDNPELVESIISEIDGQLDKLSEIEQKISELKNVAKCTCCGSNNPVDSIYCSKCGCKLAKAQTGPEDIAMDAVVSEDDSVFNEYDDKDGIDKD